MIHTDAGRGLPSKMDCVQTHGAAGRPHVEPLREAVRSVVMDPVLHTSGVLYRIKQMLLKMVLYPSI